LLERLEVPIRREHAAVPARSNGADEEVGIRALHASTTALVEESRRQLIVFRLQPQILECAQPIAQTLILLVRANPGKQFLADRPDHQHAVGDDEAFKLLGNGIVPKR
jgi:hypothetical protein